MLSTYLIVYSCGVLCRLHYIVMNPNKGGKSVRRYSGGCPCFRTVQTCTPSYGKAPPPSSAAFRELHSQNYTILRREASPSECQQLLESATREEYKSKIGGDQRRKFAVNATSAPLASHIISRVSSTHTACICEMLMVS